jgi:hypothetical protein
MPSRDKKRQRISLLASPTPDLPDATATNGPVQAPPGYVWRPKYRIPAAEDCDCVRQLCLEGGDEYEVPNGDGVLKKSHGVDPDFWEKNTTWEEKEGNLKAQFPDHWCESLSDDDLLAMYQRQNGITAAKPYPVSGVMGLCPANAVAMGDQLVEEMVAASRGCGMHDPERLSPLLRQVQKIESLVRSVGATAAFDTMVALLSALDESRGDSGWTYTTSHTGEVVTDVSGLMLTALATVVLGIAHQNHTEGTTAGNRLTVGTPAWVALRTALDMRSNIDPMLGGKRCDEMRARLEKYAEILEAAAKGGGAVATATVAPKCGPDELTTTLDDFISAHGSAIQPEEDDFTASSTDAAASVGPVDETSATTSEEEEEGEGGGGGAMHQDRVAAFKSSMEEHFTRENMWTRSLEGVKQNAWMPVFMPMGAPGGFNDAAAAQLADALNGTWQTTEVLLHDCPDLSDNGVDLLLDALDDCSVHYIRMGECPQVSAVCRSRVRLKCAEVAVRELKANSAQTTRIHWPKDFATEAMVLRVAAALPGNTCCGEISVGAPAATAAVMSKLAEVIPQSGVRSLDVDGTTPPVMRKMCAQTLRQLLASDDAALTRIEWCAYKHDTREAGEVFGALVGNTCCRSLYIEDPQLRGESLRQQLITGICASKLTNVKFGDCVCTDFTSASGWTTEEQDEVERCGIANTLHLVSNNDDDVDEIDWSSCKHVDAEVLHSLAKAIKDSSCVRSINLCHAGAKLDEPDSFEQSYQALHDGLMALEAALDFTPVMRLKLDEDEGWSEFAGCSFPVPRAAIARRCAHNEKRLSVYRKSLAINRPFQRMLLAALHTGGRGDSSPLVQIPQFPVLSTDLLQMIAGALHASSDVPCDVSAEAKERRLYWPDDDQDGEPIQTVDFAWHAHEVSS